MTKSEIQSPLFVRTDSDSTVSSLDTENFDGDNDSIDSEEIESGSVRRPTVNRLDTDIHISDGYETVNFGLGLKSEETYSTDPFAINYRKKADWDPATKAQWQREWGFIPDLIEKYESVEHAEFTRPFDQFRVLLQRRSLYEEYQVISTTLPDDMTRACTVMNMLLQEAPDLIVRYAALERLARERLAIAANGGKSSWELAWEKRRAVELGLRRTR